MEKVIRRPSTTAVYLSDESPTRRVHFAVLSRCGDRRTDSRSHCPPYQHCQDSQLCSPTSRALWPRKVPVQCDSQFLACFFSPENFWGEILTFFFFFFLCGSCSRQWGGGGESEICWRRASPPCSSRVPSIKPSLMED